MQFLKIIFCISLNIPILHMSWGQVTDSSGSPLSHEVPTLHSDKSPSGRILTSDLPTVNFHNSSHWLVVFTELPNSPPRLFAHPSFNLVSQGSPAPSPGNTFIPSSPDLSSECSHDRSDTHPGGSPESPESPPLRYS